MTGIPDELLEKAGRVGAVLLELDWDSLEADEREEASAYHRLILEAVGLPALLEDNEQLRVSVNRQFGEPLDEVYKTDGVAIVMQQIHDLRRDRDALAAKVAELESAAVSPYSTEAAYAQLDREHPTWRTRAASDETSPNLRDWLSAIVRPRLSAADLTQADAAAFIGTSEKHLSQILNGRADASIAMWQRLLNFVNVDLRAALTEGTEG